MTLRSYPQLPGLLPNVTWRPIWSGEVQQHTSGAEFRVSYWSQPLWEWDLEYEILRDGNFQGGAWDELKKIVGLFNASLGSTYGFSFFNPDDYHVFQQLIGTTDGATATYTLVRTYGANNPALGYEGTENIGFLDQTQPFALYLDGSASPIAPTDPTYGYTLSTTTPCLQQIVFNSIPTSGHVIRVDQSYTYFARFKDQQQEFTKFMNKLWMMNKVTVRSLRSETLPS
jgi:uncharacterized protein DUF2460